MRLATIRTQDGTRAARREADELVLLAYPSVDVLLRDPEWVGAASRSDGPRIPSASADFAPAVVAPGKIICVGLNYRSHIAELGRPMPEYPTLFAKFATSLIGAFDDIQLTQESEQVDWEVELAVIIGRRCRRVSIDDAEAVIAGFTVINDVTVRDWQWRTTEWLQGKTFDATTPLGPELVTLGELESPDDLEISCDVDGSIVQRARTSDLLFRPAALISYISRIMTLEPGDVIATGTPGGIGFARDPKQFLRDGTVMTTSIAGVGTCMNRCVIETQSDVEETTTAAVPGARSGDPSIRN